MHKFLRQIENNSSPLVRVVRLVLLVLIIIGIGLLLTLKMWVPKLVNIILSSEEIPTVVIPEVQPNLTLSDGRQCYSYNHEATGDEPYTVNEFLDITINNKIVIGTKKGTQNGPDMTNGYNGTISGTSNNNLITDTFSYVIEGSAGKEKEIYRTNKTGIEKLRYPLVEENKILVPDTTKEYKVLQYHRVGCVSSN